MLLQQQTEIITFECKHAVYEFLPSGDVFRFTSGNIMMNRFCGNPLEGSVNNIYLRIYDGEKRQVYPLLGQASGSSVSRSDDRLFFRGEAGNVSYLVTFAAAAGGAWFWKVDLTGNVTGADLIYGQDLGLADEGAVRTNELYMSQYLDHHIEEGSHGYVICSRQNQSQGGKFPYLQQGCLNTRIISYSTDEMQFFGKEYKKTNIPKALSKDLEGCNYQFELAYTALQTEVFPIEGNKTVVFYGAFRENHKEAVSGLEYQEDIRAMYDTLDWSKQEITETVSVPVIREMGQPYCSEPFTGEETAKWFPNRILEETEGGKLLSFFLPDNGHVVLQEKELLVERPHGNIITTLAKEEEVSKDLLTSTNYIYGLFHAQVVIGNTDMNKMSCVNRGLLNILKNTGQRIYLKLEGEWRILTLPAAYEMGTGYSRWYYKINSDTLIITSFSAAEEAAMVLTAQSENGTEYEFLITNQLAMGNREFEEVIELYEEKEHVVLRPLHTSILAGTYPDIQYTITYPGQAFSVSDDRIFFEDGKARNATMLTMATTGTGFSMIIRGYLDKGSRETQMQYEFEVQKQKYEEFYKRFTNHLRVSCEGHQEELNKLNVLTAWYTHNALVHFAVPHGLEQCSGAAWGTRDVCQGPMELFLITGHFKLARNVLLEIYSHQFEESKEWPQWFMFDKYPYQAGDCHGDVVFWPLKCVGDYLEYTKDMSVLEEKLPYRHMDGTQSSEKVKLLDHLMHAVETIQERFIYDTSLISYAGGDWDDTLQPADPAMKEKMVSAWTQALAYQVIGNLAGQLSGIQTEYAAKLTDMSEKIRKDFRKYLVRDGVVAGFAYLEDREHISYLLHPLDEKTGILYRLLPLTRSIISGLADQEEAQHNVKLIHEHLTFPDGIRLMDRPARYEGGVSRYFQRAEQASNVGREISLQYVHAHIRYIEAMAAYGDGRDAYENLLKIVPIKLKETVRNARLRQSNAYYSSSEGAFQDRYQYQEEFDKLKTGEIEVKGGWRIYSSGPGIFLARWIGDLLGIRVKAHCIEIDPVLPKKLDGLNINMDCYGQEVTFICHVESEKAGLTGLVSGGKQLAFEKSVRKYRTAGAVISKENFLSCLGEDNIIHVYLG